MCGTLCIVHADRNVCVHMKAHMHGHVECTFVYVCVNMRACVYASCGTWASVYIGMRARVLCVCESVCTCLCMCMHARKTYASTQIHRHMEHANIHTHNIIHTQAHKLAYICTNSHTYAQTHIHTHKLTYIAHAHVPNILFLSTFCVLESAYLPGNKHVTLSCTCNCRK